MSRSDTLPGGTVTLTVPTPTYSVITLTVPQAGAAQQLQAALADPAAVAALPAGPTKRLLAAQLRNLDAFLGSRPALRPYRAHIWYVAQHARPPLAPRTVAALLWCTVWFPNDCG